MALPDRAATYRTTSDRTVSVRTAFILVDGIGDVSIPELRQRTPLQTAFLPNLDAVASAGVNGLMDPVEPGLACGSDTAHLSILGYNPRIYYRGRGAFESMGAGLPMAAGDIAFKSNFATVNDETGIVVSRRADRHFEKEGPIMCAALDGLKIPGFPEYCVNVRYATEHRCGVVVRGPRLSGAISGTDPLKDHLPLPQAKPLDDSPEALNTAAVVNALSDIIRKTLREHPINAERRSQGKGLANVVLLRGCGIRMEVPTFEDSHSLKACMVAPTKIIAGVGVSLGIDILEAPGATGDYRTLLSSKAEAISAALAPVEGCVPNIIVPGEDEPKPGLETGYDFGFLHIKAIDDAGHDKAVWLKVHGLEAVDKMIGQLARRLWTAEKEGVARYLLCVTGDHSTPVQYGDHSYEPVPFTICHLSDFVRARGGESVVLSTSLDPFPLPQHSDDVSQSENLEPDLEKQKKAVSGDGVAEFSEIAAARGYLGRFPGCEMIKIIKNYAAILSTGSTSA